ncbi:MAG: response regulator transcription factor [Hydrogenophaga sp.]|nr:response regulator transcription factor [Hydrogenophaga sp.]
MTRILLLHDDPVVKAGLTRVLEPEVDLQVIQLDEAHVFSAGHPECNVVVVDYARGILLLEQKAVHRSQGVRSSIPPVLILTRRESEVEIRHVLEKGALGYLTMECSIEELLHAIRSVCVGQRYIGSTAAQRLADSVSCELLTTREVEILRLVVEGYGNKAIARGLNIALGTVKSHLKSVFSKLQATNRTEVAAMADKRGLLVQLPSAGMKGRINIFQSHHPEKTRSISNSKVVSFERGSAHPPLH